MDWIEWRKEGQRGIITQYRNLMRCEEVKQRQIWASKYSQEQESNRRTEILPSS